MEHGEDDGRHDGRLSENVRKLNPCKAYRVSGRHRLLREALTQAEGHDAASERLRQFVAEIRMVPEHGTLSIAVKANAEKILEAGGLIPSSRVGCGGGI